MELLLTVEDHFLIKHRGLVVVPGLDLPENRRFKPFSDKVVIRKPDGTEEQCLAYLGLEHFNLGDKGSIWHIILQFPEETKATVPIGSQVFVSEDLLRKLDGEMPNKPDSVQS
jgi:hypothetical protein